MKKKFNILIAYLIVIIFCILYSGFSSEVFITMFCSIIVAVSMYSQLLAAKFLKRTGISEVLMIISNDKFCYLIYIVFIEIGVVAIYMSIMFLNTRQFIYTVMYLPLITTYHSCKLFCKIITLDE